MRTIFRKSLIVLFLLFSLSVVAGIGHDAKAQFLGQQSLSQSSYVIDQSGNLWAWGDNFYGQLGVGDRMNRNTPVQVPVPTGASKWVLVSGGQNFAVAVADSDKLYAWGLNDEGQIGIGVGDGLYGVPMRIQNPPGVTTWKWVSAGADNCEALTSDGRLFAWGDNDRGQLGVGTTQYTITPQPVQFPDGVTAWEDVAAGPGYTMMIAQDNLLYACGKDSLDDFEAREGPVQTRFDPFRAFSPLPCLGASYLLDTRIDEEKFYGNGFSAYNEYFVGPTGGSPNYMAAVADGGWHALFLTNSGTLITAGENTYGQLGIGSDSALPNGTIAFPTGVTQFVAIAAGLKHSLAIGNDGWLYAWGDDSVGELGLGNFTNQSKPVRVLKVCDPLAMTASFTAPSVLVPGYTITVNVHDDATSPALTNTNAYLALNQPLTYLNGAPEESYGPQILPNNTGSMSWNITDFTNLETDTPIYFAYVRANGSAPLLISGKTIVNAEWVTAYVYGNVEDSITNDPLADAHVYAYGLIGGVSTGRPGNFTDTTDQLGNFTDTLRLGGQFVCGIVKENYNTTGSGPWYEEDSIDYETFYLGPSSVQGTFTVPGTPFLADSIQKVYYPDSLIGYALSRRAIFRTLDSGIHWTAMYVANENLHDVKFIDPAHGWVVGDSGTILNTTDSGKTWQSVQVGTKDLRALFVIDFDTAWAVGDNGTVLKDSDNTWTEMSPLSANDLTSIHFLNSELGVIGGNYVYYLYNAGTWSSHGIGESVQAVYYTAPGDIFLAGANGEIVNYNINAPNPPGLLAYEYTNSSNTINSIYFLNSGVGYALGDSGSSSVTYDGGKSWAPMPEFPHNATSINFFSLAGHGAADNGVLNYDGEPNVVKAIVRGRITYGNPPEPIMGAQIVREYAAEADTVEVFNLIDTAYTNEQGNFVFSGVDGVFPYEYHIHFMDSGIEKTKIFTGIQGHRHQITTLNYNDYEPPIQDTVIDAVTPSPQAALSLDVSATQSAVQISYSIPTDAPVRVVIQDVLGHVMRVVQDGFVVAGEYDKSVALNELAAGSYYVTIESSQERLTKKFQLIK